MMWTAYILAGWGFSEAGWSFWQCLWWPYYAAKRYARQAKEE